MDWPGRNELPQPVVDDLLTLHEAHATLRHLLTATDAAPRHEVRAAPWDQLTPWDPHRTSWDPHRTSWEPT